MAARRRTQVSASPRWPAWRAAVISAAMVGGYLDCKVGDDPAPCARQDSYLILDIINRRVAGRIPSASLGGHQVVQGVQGVLVFVGFEAHRWPANTRSGRSV